MEQRNDPVIIASKDNYGGNVSYQNSKFDCYTKKQMKAMFPKGNANICGEFIPDRKTGYEGTFTNGQKKFRLFKAGSGSRMAFAVKGYVATESGEFIALLKKVLWQRIAAIVVACAIIAAGVIYLPGMLALQVPDASADGIGVDLEEGAVDWAGMQSNNTGGVTEGIRIPGYKSITVQSGTTDVKVSFQNPEQNNCYFVIHLILTDTNEELYVSKMIEPGKGLYDITLSRALDPGTYAAMIKYDTYTISDSPTPLNGANVNIDLIAE